MNVNELLAERTPREKFLLAVMLVAAVVVGGYYLLDSPAPVPTPAQAPAPIMTARAAVPVTTAANQPVGRDPFLPPPEFANFDKPLHSSNVPPEGAYPGGSYPPGKQGGPVAMGQGGAPTLKGVVNSNGNYMAIISVGTGGRAYGVGENAGGYVVESVSMKSATLSGPGGRLVLTLGK